MVVHSQHKLYGYIIAYVGWDYMGKSKKIHFDRLLISVPLGLVIGLATQIALGVDGNTVITSGSVIHGKIDTNKYSEYADRLKANSSLTVKPGEVVIFMNTDITMESGNSLAKLLIQNNINNEYAQRIKLVDIGTGVIIYNSDIIEPGFSIPESVLDIKLNKGEYTCKAYADLIKNGVVVDTLSIHDVKIRVLS